MLDRQKELDQRESELSQFSLNGQRPFSSSLNQIYTAVSSSINSRLREGGGISSNYSIARSADSSPIRSTEHMFKEYPSPSRQLHHYHGSGGGSRNEQSRFRNTALSTEEDPLLSLDIEDEEAEEEHVRLSHPMHGTSNNNKNNRTISTSSLLRSSNHLGEENRNNYPSSSKYRSSRNGHYAFINETNRDNREANNGDLWENEDKDYSESAVLKEEELLAIFHEEMRKKEEEWKNVS